MQKSNDPGRVRRQYASPAGLQTRQGLHQKYGVNPVSFADWLFPHYAVKPGDRILEMGCGTGNFWEARAALLPPGARLTLTDFSAGMVEEARGRLAGQPNVAVGPADIQALPYGDESFDVAIANHMLYHVPDLDKALDQVYRVLKPGGVFYAATNGSGGMRKFNHEALKDYDPAIDAFGEGYLPFTLQNGAQVLGRRFGRVEMEEYPNELRVTSARDLADYLRSAGPLAELPPGKLAGLDAYFQRAIDRDGAIVIPMEVGLFTAWKAEGEA